MSTAISATISWPSDRRAAGGRRQAGTATALSGSNRTGARKNLQSLPRPGCHDGAAVVRDAGPFDGAVDRRRHRARPRRGSGLGRRLSGDRRGRGLHHDHGLRRIHRPIRRTPHDTGRHAGAGHGPCRYHRGLAAAVCAGSLRWRPRPGTLDALQLTPARPALAAAPGTSDLFDQADRRAGGADAGGCGGAGAGRRVRLAGGSARRGRPLPRDGGGAAAAPRALRHRPQSRPATIARRHPRQCRQCPARPGAAHALCRHVQLRRFAIALHRLLRALSRARPWLRP